MLVFNFVFDILWTACYVAFIGFSEIKLVEKHGYNG
jgi:hypothetical protein